MKQWSLFAGLVGALVFSLSSVTRAPSVLSVNQSSEAVTDCDELQDRMELNVNDVDQNASCSVTSKTADGRVIKKTFRARVAMQARRVVGATQNTSTAALVIDELCETCQNGTKQHVRPLDSIKDIRDWALAQAQGDLDAAERADKADGCAITADGRPGKTVPSEIMVCRISNLTGQNPAADLKYYQKWLAPDLRRLLLSTNAQDRELGARALVNLQPLLQNNPVARESVQMMGNYVYFADHVARIEANLTQLSGQPAMPPAQRAQQLAALGVLKQQWAYNYKQRRANLRPEVPDGAVLIETSKELEASLDRMYAKFGKEVPAIPGAPGEGRTMFGTPRAEGTRPVVGTPAVGRGAVPTAPGVGAGGVNPSIFRPR